MSLTVMRSQDQSVIVSNGVIADQFWTRLCGLIGKTEFNAGEGMLFPKCNNIHMWMMQMPIDVLFLKNMKIVKAVSGVQPWKLLPVYCFDAQDTLELPVGTISKFNLKTGEVLCIAS